MSLKALLLSVCFCASIIIAQNAETVKDADGNEYSTVKIGNQIWTVENWRSTKYSDGTAIPLVTDSSAWVALTTPGCCFFKNSTDSSFRKKWGALYNWYAVNTGKLAPKGWHVPTDNEWITLEKYLIANGYNYDKSTMGNKIAQSMAAKTDWAISPIKGSIGKIGSDLTKNNRSGFAALPGGDRYPTNGRFISMGYNGCWWSNSEVNKLTAWYRNLSNEMVELNRRDPVDKRSGLSVRIIRDLN